MQIDDPKNQFTFECPATGDNERLALCLFKRAKKWQGRSLGVAICECAMDAGKCAAARVMAPFRNLDEKALVDSSGGRVSKLPRDVIESVMRSSPTPTMLGKYPMLKGEEIERLNHTEFGDAAAPKAKRKRAASVVSEATPTPHAGEIVGANMAAALNDAIGVAA